MYSLKDLFKYFLEVPDTTKSDRAAITLRCPRGVLRGRKPPAGSWAESQYGSRPGAPTWLNHI